MRIRLLGAVLLTICIVLMLMLWSTAPTALAQGQEKITICHLPPGNPANAQTITIAVAAWQADGSGPGHHGPGLHGGDYLGPCSVPTSTHTEVPPTPTPVCTNTPTPTPDCGCP